VLSAYRWAGGPIPPSDLSVEFRAPVGAFPVSGAGISGQTVTAIRSTIAMIAVQSSSFRVPLRSSWRDISGFINNLFGFDHR
jgi:hypothetical protein